MEQNEGELATVCMEFMEEPEVLCEPISGAKVGVEGDEMNRTILEGIPSFIGGKGKKRKIEASIVFMIPKHWVKRTIMKIGGCGEKMHPIVDVVPIVDKVPGVEDKCRVFTFNPLRDQQGALPVVPAPPGIPRDHKTN